MNRKCYKTAIIIFTTIKDWIHQVVANIGNLNEHFARNQNCCNSFLFLNSILQLNCLYTSGIGSRTKREAGVSNQTNTAKVFCYAKHVLLVISV